MEEGSFLWCGCETSAAKDVWVEEAWVVVDGWVWWYRRRNDGVCKVMDDGVSGGWGMGVGGGE